MRTDLVNFSPPCTIRWPTATMDLRSSTTPIFAVQKGVNDEFDRVFMIAALMIELDRLASHAGLIDIALADTDSFHHTGGQCDFLGIVVQAVFYR